MPRHRRPRGSRFSAIAWSIAFIAAVAVGSSFSTGVVSAEEDPPPTASDPGPSSTPPPIECTGAGSAGPLPSGTQAISGTVTSAGAPVEGITVRLAEFGNVPAQSTETNPLGEYQFLGLGNGSYSVAFDDGSGGFVNGFWDGAGSPVLAPADATPVDLTGSGQAGVDAELVLDTPRTVSGTLTDHLGQPVPGGFIRATGRYLPLVACGPAASGTFGMTNVDSGVYVLRVTGSGFPEGFYENGAPGNFTTNAAQATPITVDADVSGISIEFPELFSLEGDVFDAGDAPIDGFNVFAQEVGGGASGYGQSAAGHFTIDGLPAGDYHVSYSDGYSIYRSGWYAGDGLSGAATEAGAMTVTVPGLSIELLAEPAPTISGRITNENGDGIPYPPLNICDEFQLVCAVVTYTDDQGYYTAAVLEPATYYVQVYPDAALYPYGGYLGTDAEGTFVHDFADALAIPVTTTNVENVDGKVPFGGRIEARLTSAGAHVDYPAVQFCIGDGLCGDGTYAYDSESDALSQAYFDGQTLYAFYDEDYDGVGVWLVDGGTASADFGDATAIVITAGEFVVISSDIPVAGEPTTPEDPNITLDDGSGNSIDMSFLGIDEGEGGVTNVATSESGPAAPDGFQLGVPATYYDFTTTAIFDSVQICISYAGVSFIAEANLRLFHYNEGTTVWDDITDDGYPDVDADRICGTTSSLSPFVLAEQSYAFTGFHGPKAPTAFNAAKAGDTIGLTFGLGGDFGLSIFTAGWPEVHQISCTTGEPIGGADATTASLKYTARKDLYTLQIATAKAWKNTCRSISFELRDGTFATVWYRLRA